MPNSHYSGLPDPGGDMPYQALGPEEAAALKLKVDQNAAEIKALRDWRHEQAQKPQADLLKVTLIEHSLTGLSEKVAENTVLTQRVLTALNGEDDKPGIRGRLDRVEGKMSTLTRFFWLFAGASLAVFIKTFWTLFATGKP